MKNVYRRTILVALIAALANGASTPASAADAAGATISGTVVTQENGLSVGNASITLYRDTAVVAKTTSDGNGRFSFADEPAAAYAVEIRATGYQTTRVDGIFVTAGGTSTVRTALIRAQTTASGLREIGNVSTSIRGTTLASSSTIQYSLSPAQLESQGYLKAADAIGQLPGFNISGGPHTVGDDTSIDIRGMGLGEVRPLLDGHGIGPIGVASPDYFNYANSPYFLLSNIQTTVGSGASGLYGIDVIGGTIDFQTLAPTARPHGEFSQSIGEQGTLITQGKATGSIGRLGYAVGHVVSGTYADFSPQQIFQGARPNNNGNAPSGGACTASNDLTTCNRLLNTYSVSGNYRVQNDLGKLRYQFDRTTSLTLTAYSGNQLSDSTGNGDNDNLPYDTRLAELQATAHTCPGGYSVVTDLNPKACYSAKRFALDSYGPLGGGQDRNRGTTLQDYHARVNEAVGANNVTVDYFRDIYKYRKNSNAAAGLDPSGTFFNGGGTYEDDYLTNGFLLSDDIATEKNDFGFGYYVEHQREYGSRFQPFQAGVPASGTTPATAAVPAAFISQPELGSGDYSFFIRNQYVPNPILAIYTNAWDRRSNVTNKTTFDPRLSVVVKPTKSDVFRLTGGRADGDPAAAIKATGNLSSIGNPSSLNPSCSILNSVATGGNPNLEPESANDYEAAYGHRFWADTSINVVGYVSSEKNALFSASQPIAQFGPLALNNPQLSGLFGQYASKIGAACIKQLDATTVLPYLGISTTYNAASALFRGVEMSGRIRATPNFYADYEYDIQSSQQTGIPINILQTNPFLINNTQIVGIPLHKGSLTFDYNTLRGVEAQIQGFYVSGNNTLNRPAYTFFNGFVSRTFGRGLRATLGATNLFDQESQSFGYFGHQVANATNQYAPAAPAGTYPSPGVRQAVALGNLTQTELIGLQPRILIFSLSAEF